MLAGLGHDVEDTWPAALFEPPAAEHPGMPFVGYRYMLRDLSRMLRRPVRPDEVEPGF